MESIINIYSDGACRGNNKEKENIGAIGVVLEYKDNIKEIKKAFENTTNNRMEILAVLFALKSIKSGSLNKNQIKIYTDSSYVVNCINEKWYVYWQEHNWKNKAKKDVKNKDLLEELIDLVSGCKNISFFHIKGHLDYTKEREFIKEYEKFTSKYGKDMLSKENFLKTIKMNHRVDELANAAMDAYITV